MAFRTSNLIRSLTFAIQDTTVYITRHYSPLIVFSLISMAKVAKEKNYTRPKLNTDNIIEIKEGRHALLEIENQNYVSNDYYSGGNHTCVKIITGPNASGKSIYLKQSTLTVYMAHVGSYVPANSANICIIYSIHTRMHTTESASVRLSAFMIDLSQVSCRTE